MDKILENPQNWVSFLTLSFTIIIGLTVLLSAILGFFTTKRFWELRDEHAKVKASIKAENIKLQQKEAQYDSLIKKTECMLDRLATEPELSQHRELLDVCISRLKNNETVDSRYISTISPAMLYVSEKGDVRDAIRLVTIFKLSTDLSQNELAIASYQALNRIENRLRLDHEFQPELSTFLPQGS